MKLTIVDVKTLLVLRTIWYRLICIVS